jgi:DNA-binding GntR family transcriptional regulator
LKQAERQGFKTPGFKTKAHVVFDDLRQRIASGALVPGERLLLRSVAEDFGCSEIPVREAFRSLAAGGFVELVPHGGAHVSAPNVKEIAELTQIRALMEPEATYLAAQELDDAALADLDKMLTEMSAIASAEHAQEYGALNRRFHDRILSACPNQKLYSMINDLWDRAERGRLVYLRGTSFIAESLAQHTEMVRLIRARDFDELRELSDRHSQFGLQAVRDLAGWEELPETRKVGSRR